MFFYNYQNKKQNSPTIHTKKIPQQHQTTTQLIKSINQKIESPILLIPKNIEITTINQNLSYQNIDSLKKEIAAFILQKHQSIKLISLNDEANFPKDLKQELQKKYQNLDEFGSLSGGEITHEFQDLEAKKNNIFNNSSKKNLLNQ